MASVSVKVSISDSLKQRLKNLDSPNTMLAIHNTLARYCDPYVPFLTGDLAQTTAITPTGVTYIQPYARYQYYGDDFNHTLDYHPLASARWDQAMMRDHREEFTEEIKDIIREMEMRR